MKNRNRCMYLFAMLMSIQIGTILPVLTALTRWEIKTENGIVQVLVLGDVHDILNFQVQDNQHKQLLIAQLKKFSGAKALCLIEANDEDFKESERAFKGQPYVPMLHEIARLSNQCNQQCNNLSFKWCDNRTEVIQHVNECNIFAGSGYSLDLLKKLKANKQEKLFTVGEYLASVDFLLKQAGQELASDAFAMEIVGKKLDELAANRERVSGVFKKYTQSADGLVIDVLNSLWNKEDGESLNELINLSFGITDPNFVVELNNGIKQHERILLFAGQAHTVVINDFLKLLGAKEIFHVGSRDRAEICVPLAKNIIQENFEAFFPQLQVEKEKIGVGCKACNKLSEKLMVCSACKIAKYCSPECQKKDWSKHKEVCKK